MNPLTLEQCAYNAHLRTCDALLTISGDDPLTGAILQLRESLESREHTLDDALTDILRVTPTTQHPGRHDQTLANQLVRVLRDSPPWQQLNHQGRAAIICQLDGIRQRAQQVRADRITTIARLGGDL